MRAHNFSKKAFIADPFSYKEKSHKTLTAHGTTDTEVVLISKLSLDFKDERVI